MWACPKDQINWRLQMSLSLRAALLFVKLHLWTCFGVMERPLSLLVALVLASTCEGWVPPNFCHGKLCPEFEVIKKTEDFEQRLYVATNWITIPVEGHNNGGLIAAYKKLKAFCEEHNQASPDDLIPMDTLPSLVTLRDAEWFLSWFMPPGTKPKIHDQAVRLEERPAATVYVRVFNGIPAIKWVEENADILQKALIKAGNKYGLDAYSVAVYEGVFSLEHHNEIWSDTA